MNLLQHKCIPVALFFDFMVLTMKMSAKGYLEGKKMQKSFGWP